MLNEAGPGEPRPLTPDQLSQLAVARRRAAKVRRAVSTARFSGWTTGLFGGLTLLGGLFSTPALLLGLAMIGCAVNELRAAMRLRELHPRAPSRLAWNQVLLCAALCGYCAWNLLSAITAPPNPELASLAAASDLGASAEQLTRGISVMVYSCAIIICVIVQSLTALYYASRARHLREYTRSTPAWIIDVQRAA